MGSGGLSGFEINDVEADVRARAADLVEREGDSSPIGRPGETDCLSAPKFAGAAP